jgi:hypothetical protein
MDELQAEWPPVLDENQELRLKFLEFAANQNLLTDKTKLELTELPVEDAGEQVEKAQTEAKARADTATERMLAQAVLQPATKAPQPAVGEMNGYGDSEAQAIVAGAIRQLAGGA